MDTSKALTVVSSSVISEQEEIVLPTIGQVANHAAMQTLLIDYQARKSAETLRRQKADIALFERYLASVAHITVENMAYDLATWDIATWGLIEAFNRWQLAEGYATGSINVRLATVKVYCEMATKAGHLKEQELALIKTVKGFRESEARNVDEKRSITRREKAKKAVPTSLSPVHVEMLKRQPDTKRGRRDALLLCLVLDHGLRVGEVADLNRDSIDLATGTLKFYRHKVHAWQEHDLTPDTYRAAQAYLADCPEDQEPLFVGLAPKRKDDGQPGEKQRVNERSLFHRVNALGAAIGVTLLSPHDGRHFWATDAIRNGTDIKSLQDAGGWSSPAMPLRYAESAKVANAGVKLSATKKKGSTE